MKPYLLCLLLFATFAYSLELSELKKATDTDLQTTCKKLQNSMFPIRCASPVEDQAKPGKLFLQRNNVSKEQLQPVLLLPGFGGSGLEAQLQSARPNSWFCYKNSSWYRVWLAFLEFFVGGCWTHNMKLEYYPMNDTYMNTIGVDVRPIDFGGVKGIDFLDYILDYPLSFTSVYGTMIRSLMSIGYEPGKSLRGVTYDWRYPPNKEPQLYDNVKALIEETYEINGNQSVHVISHSMGGPMFLYFLNQMPYEWKQKYIHSFIPIAAPWSGSPKALRALISGDDFGINVMGYSIPNKLNFRELARTLGGLVFLVPDSHYWKDEVLVSTSSYDYTTGMIPQLLKDLNATTTGQIYQNIDGMMYQLGEPDVKVHCLYGINMPTEIKYYYDTDNFDRDPTKIDYSESGDGTVPLRSLELCGKWAKYQKEEVTTKEFDLRDHFGIIEDPEIVDYVLKVVTGKL